MSSTPAAFPFFRELIAFLTSPLLIGLVLISSISGTSSAVGFVGGDLLRISPKCSFYLASLLGSSVMVLPPLSLIAVFLWVLSVHMLASLLSRIESSCFPYPLHAAHHLSHSLLSDFLHLLVFTPFFLHVVVVGSFWT